MTEPSPQPAHGVSTGDWLRGSAADHARYADMTHRFRRPYIFGAAITVAKLVAAIWYGPIVLVMLLVGAATMVVAVLVKRHATDELGAASAFALLELNLALTVLLTGGGTSALLPLLAVPVFSQAVLFRPKVFLAAGIASAVLAVAAVGLAPLLPAAPAAPPVSHLVSYLALLTCLVAAGLFLASADLSSRDDAVLDPLTGLLNRLTLADRFTEVQQRATATKGSVGLLMIDVDHFKQINDTLGHARGDNVLKELADRLRLALRSSDVAYRVGGEEFVVLLPDRDVAGAYRVAERVRTAIAAQPLSGVPATVSIGIACSANPTRSLNDLLIDADTGLYAAKRAGRNRSATSNPA